MISRLCLQWGILGQELWAYFNVLFQNMLSCVFWCFCPGHREDSLLHLSCLLKMVRVGGRAGERVKGYNGLLEG